MNTFKIIRYSIFTLLLLLQGINSRAQELVELKQPKTGKVVIKLMFRNGSIADPAGKEGITYLTANLMVDGGTEKHSATEIQKIIYPWAARISCFTDKEVSTFTFEVPSEYLEKFSGLIQEMILHPGFKEGNPPGSDRLLQPDTGRQLAFPGVCDCSCGQRQALPADHGIGYGWSSGVPRPTCRQ